ncbi:MAG: FG-GAP repeat domain-containing protein [Desulfuromonadales bacterium]
MLARKKLKTIMLVSLVLFLWFGLATAFAGTITGTVTNASSAADTRVYLKVMSAQGWDEIYGTSITTPGAYTIRQDLPDGDYMILAVLDTVGEGVPVSSMPLGFSAPFAVTGSNATGVNIQLDDPAASDLVPAAPQMAVTVPGDGGFLLFWEGSRNMNDFSQAESYNVYLKENSAPVVGIDDPVLSNLSENDMNFVFLTGLSNGGSYYVGVTGVIGASESAITLAFGGASPTVPAAPTGASNSVSGTVNITGPALTGPLYVLLMDDSNEQAAWVKLDSPTVATVYSVSDLADGNYFVMAFVDQDNNGYFSSGDLANMDHGPTAMISGGDVTGVNVSVTNSGAYATVGTDHQIYDNESPDTYSLIFNIDRNFKRPVGVAVTSGLSQTIDLGVDTWGGFNAWRQVGTSRPGVPELYDLLVTYSDGSSETITAGTTAVLDSPAMPLGPIGQVAGATTPTFRWVGPQVNEAAQPFLYGLNMYDGHGLNWGAWDIPSDQLSYIYDGQPLVTGTQYFWNVSIFDENDNQISYNVDFTPVAASTVTISGSASDSVGMLDGVTVQEVGNPGNSAVTDAGGLFSLQIAQGSVFALEFSKTGYPTMQSKFMTAGSSFNTGSWYMFTDADFTSMGTSAGTGIIRSTVKDSETGSPLAGATITALSSLSPGTEYTVQYLDSTAGNWSGIATDASGKFRVLNVIDGDTVILTGDLAGYDFAEVYMQVYSGQMAEGSVRGTSLLPIFAHFSAPTATLLTTTFNGEALVDSNLPGQTRLTAVGDELAVFDADGILCGRTQVTVEGEFGPLTVYGDDPATVGVDEGASEGETLTVRLWDSQRQKELPVRTLQLNGDRQTLVWNDGGGATVLLQGLAQDRIGLFRNGQWRMDADGNETMNAGDIFYPSFGITGDKAVAGDWNGDGITDIGVFRNGQWRLDVNNNGVMNAGDIYYPSFGIAGDLPVVGDWNGDGTADIGVYRNGQWRLDTNNDGNMAAGDIYYPSFGIAGDIPIAGDWNGDGTVDIGLFRNGQWRLDLDHNGVMNAGDIYYPGFGIAGDIPVVGDWNADGITDIGVFRNGQWRLDLDNNGIMNAGDVFIPSLGLSGDQPVAGKWN